MEKNRNANTVLVGKPDGKRPLTRPGLRWEYSAEIHLAEVAEPE
jgi:hypothetical protein